MLFLFAGYHWKIEFNLCKADGHSKERLYFILFTSILLALLYLKISEIDNISIPSLSQRTSLNHTELYKLAAYIPTASCSDKNLSLSLEQACLSTFTPRSNSIIGIDYPYDQGCKMDRTFTNHVLLVFAVVIVLAILSIDFLKDDCLRCVAPMLFLFIYFILWIDFNIWINRDPTKICTLPDKITSCSVMIQSYDELVRLVVKEKIHLCKGISISEDTAYYSIKLEPSRVVLQLIAMIQYRHDIFLYILLLVSIISFFIGPKIVEYQICSKSLLKNALYSQITSRDVLGIIGKYSTEYSTSKVKFDDKYFNSCGCIKAI